MTIAHAHTLTLSRLYFSSLLTPAWGVISPYIQLIIHPALDRFMYTLTTTDSAKSCTIAIFTHLLCIQTFVSQIHAPQHDAFCLLVAIQCSIVHEHGHNAHTMHMIGDRFRLLDAIVNPPGSFSDLYTYNVIKQYSILLLATYDTLRFWMIWRNWITLAGLLWAMVGWELGGGI